MKLSVIIPCLNAEATLAEQLEALSVQQWSEPWELIISDNGSTDNSGEIARSYKDRFPSFKVVDASVRRGGPYALNTGAKAASSDRFAVCDADDEVAPGWVAAMGNALSRYDVVCGKFLFDKFNKPAQAEKWNQAWKDGFYKGRFLPGGGSGNFGIRRWVHEAVGGFDECLPHGYDADYFWRLQLEGFELHHVLEAVIQVRMGRVSPSLSSLYRRGRIRTASNYWSYKRYRHFGMLPPPPLKESLVIWLSVLRRGARAWVRNKQTKVAWLQQFAQLTGELLGQLQGRITNPCKPYHPGKKGALHKGEVR
jgi:glycosyltransferase involved in cell wall biosynthesis